MIASLVVMAALAALVAVYAQAHIPDFTAGTAKAMLTRSLLAGVGFALGFLARVHTRPTVWRGCSRSSSALASPIFLRQ